MPPVPPDMPIGPPPMTIFHYEVLVNWQTLLLCMGIFVVVYIMRLVIQASWAGWQKNVLYNHLFLPLMPLVVGFGVAWIRHFPWPDPLAHSQWAKVFYCVVCGMASGWVYARVRSIVTQSGMLDPQIVQQLPQAEMVIPQPVIMAAMPAPVAPPIVVPPPIAPVITVTPVVAPVAPVETPLPAPAPIAPNVAPVATTVPIAPSGDSSAK